MGYRKLSGSEYRDSITTGSKPSGNDSCELRVLKVFQFLNPCEAKVPGLEVIELPLQKGSSVYLSSVLVKPQEV